jgi:hypothetical protein
MKDGRVSGWWISHSLMALFSTTICTMAASCSSVNRHILFCLSVLQTQSSIQYSKHYSNTVYKINMLQSSIAPNFMSNTLNIYFVSPYRMYWNLQSLLCFMFDSRGKSSREVQCLQYKPILIWNVRMMDATVKRLKLGCTLSQASVKVKPGLAT